MTDPGFPMNIFVRSKPKEKATDNMVLDDAEASIADAMKSLSVEERQLAILDTHGVADLNDETDDFLEQKFKELEYELLDIDHKNAYSLAKSTSPAYVCDRKFRLMFLRADCFDVKAAAKRMVLHFEKKLELFGKDLLGRDIRASDLDEEDRRYNTGHTQLIPQRDRAGRAVIFHTPERYIAPLKNRLRVQWFLFMTALRDDQTQRNGIVGIIYNIGGEMGSFNFETALRLPGMLRAIPFRFVAGHACLDNEATRPILSAIFSVFDQTLRSRCRLHFGKFLSCGLSIHTRCCWMLYSTLVCIAQGAPQRSFIAFRRLDFQQNSSLSTNMTF